MSRLVVIDYGAGNLASVANALQVLGILFEVSEEPRVVEKAKALILPGVGAAGHAMEKLKEKGLDTVIKTQVNKGIPILGVCLGMQLLMSSSEEDNTQCLGLLPGKVKKFKTELKVPQMGWNQVATAQDSALLKEVPDNSYFYFVHSYYCDPDDQSAVKGTTNYDTDFCSVFEKGNLYGAQFHPEKSDKNGLQILRNFWEAAC